MRRLCAMLVAALLGVALGSCDLSAPPTVTVDTSVRHQTMAGWEATARLWEFDKAGDRFDASWLAQRDTLFDLLVNDAGIDRLRLEIRSGTENPVDYWGQFAAGRIGYRAFKQRFYAKINDNVDPLRLDPARVQFSELDWRVENIVLPVKARVEARGRRFRLNLAYVDFKWGEDQGTLSHARQPQEYAELIVATVSHLKSKYGLSPDDIEIIVEPDNSVAWHGTEIGAAMVALRSRFAAAGLALPAIIAPSTAQARRALPTFAALATVDGAAAGLASLSYHRYEGAPGPTLLGMLRTTAHAAGAATAMLEYVDGDVDDLFDDLTYADASAWQLFGIATRPRGARTPPGWLIVARDGTAPQLTPTARALAQLFNHVPQGSVRIDARSSTRALRSVAFITPNGQVVLALRSTKAGPVTIAGLPPGRYRVSSDAGTPPRDIIVTTGLRYALPAGVTTSFVGYAA